MSRLFIIILHILYWFLFLSLLLLFYTFLVLIPGFEKMSTNKTGSFVFWIKLMTGFAVIPALISFYTFYTVLFTGLLSKRKFVLFCIAGIAVSLLAAIIGALAESTEFLFGKNYLFNDDYRSAIIIIAVMAFGAFINGVIGAIIRGFITWYNEIRYKEELQSKNHQMELELIKAQVNPHFLFNTLNNIDVLIEQDAEKASDYLRKLSEILRFMLYESKSQKISASREIEYIEKYLALQQLRNSNPAFVDFKIEGNPAEHVTEPMIFIPFIENAFKHANNKNMVHGIRIHFDFSGTDTRFLCTNAYQQEAEKMFPGGLGNPLIRKRLKLLYPDSHQLTTSEDGEMYIIELIINDTYDLRDY
ncbi:histidine kinase [Pollutibacter soli]|uniref:sensor histidine kinase n=1 Tax=Pollutibacter soli TaxID=3034157 RepID=UPI003013D0C5